MPSGEKTAGVSSVVPEASSAVPEAAAPVALAAVSSAAVSTAGSGRAAGRAGIWGTASISSSRRPSSALARSVSAVA